MQGCHAQLAHDGEQLEAKQCQDVTASAGRINSRERLDIAVFIPRVHDSGALLLQCDGESVLGLANLTPVGLAEPPSVKRRKAGVFARSYVGGLLRLLHSGPNQSEDESRLDHRACTRRL
jgi:hypothetical protein